MANLLQPEFPILDVSFTNDEHKWQSVIDRNPLANGAFLYAVISTNIFCRPVCPARLPRRENTIFFPNSESAEAAGFRPCLRCRPDAESPQSARTALIANACRTIEADKKVSLEGLAEQANPSKFHFQRTFKSVIGITPQQYKMGYHEHVKSHKKIIFVVGPCYLGHILVAVSERGICTIDLGDDPDVLVQPKKGYN